MKYKVWKKTLFVIQKDDWDKITQCGYSIGGDPLNNCGKPLTTNTTYLFSVNDYTYFWLTKKRVMEILYLIEETGHWEYVCKEHAKLLYKNKGWK